MNAKEARLSAKKNSIEIEKEKRLQANRVQAEAAKRWHDEKIRWQTDMLGHIEYSIGTAVEHGSDKVSIWLASFDKEETAREEEFCKLHAYKPELKKIIAHFTKLGYQLNFKVKKEKHVDLSDLSPREDWYTYETQLEIAW